MVKRNDPCPCGSGKKYKKCCGSSGVDLMDIIVNEELDRVLMKYFETYPLRQDREEMLRLMRKWVNHLSDSWDKEHIEEASSEYYLFIENVSGWKTYIEEERQITERTAVLNVLKEWDEPILLLGEVTQTDEQFLYIDALFSTKTFKMARNEQMPADVGTLLFGIVLKDIRQGDDAIAPISSMLFLAKWSKQTKKSLIEKRATEPKIEISLFLKEHALFIYELFIQRSMATLNELVEEVLSKDQLAALNSIEEELRKLGQSSTTREMMHKLAVAYFLNEETIIHEQNAFIAAIVKVGKSIGVIQQTDIDEAIMTKRFNVEQATIHTYEKELLALYDSMMQSGNELVAEKRYAVGTDPRPTEKSLWETSMTTGGVVIPERKPTIAGGRAQLLAYEAYSAAIEQERRKLAKQAYEMDPNNPDALLLQAEITENHDAAIALYERAIREASKTFETGENPWQNIPNRPFMRAAFVYGIYLFEKGQFDDAASLFLDLIKMNPTDHQGARYEAIASLIHAKRFEEAAEILLRYEKGSSNDAAYLYLDWKLEHAGSNGESVNSAEMLKTAERANGHVLHLQTFRVASIAYPKFQELEPGSQEEARYIWLLIG